MPESISAVLHLAVASRLLLLTLIIFWRSLFHPYDTSASLNPPCLGHLHPSDLVPIRWPALAAAVESSVVWDGVFFLRIAECGGYEYEQTYAFLPLLPFAMVLLSKSVFAPLVPLIGYRAVLALSGYVLNNVAFVVATVFLYRLSVLILKDSAVSLRACVLFCFNPASIFYSSVYSESLYALCSLGGLFYLFSGANTIAMLLLALSGAARSNGAINAGYFCFMAILRVYDTIYQKKRPTVAVLAVISAIARSIFVFVPFIGFQAYGYLNICQDGVSDELRPWCKARIPLLYSFLQSHYWGVGFLRYFQVKQLPNFLLASPVLSLAVCAITSYISKLPAIFQFFREERTIVSPVGDSQSSVPTSQLKYAILQNSTREIKKSIAACTFSTLHASLLECCKRQFTWAEVQSVSNQGGNPMVRQRRKESLEMTSGSSQDPHSHQDARQNLNQGYHSVLVLPFILHLAFMTFTAFFVMHVQVATRFLSASPPIYWFASCVLGSPSSTSRKVGYFIWVYFITYILLGSLLFSNFYPFT